MKLIVGLLVVAVLAVGSGCAKADWIDRTLVTVDVAGFWEGTLEGITGVGSGQIRLELQQKGSIVTGQMQIEGRQTSRPLPSGPIEGSLAGDLLKFKNARQSFTAELTVAGDEMTGHAAPGPFRVSLRRIDSSLPLPRRPGEDMKAIVGLLAMVTLAFGSAGLDRPHAGDRGAELATLYSSFSNRDRPSRGVHTNYLAGKLSQDR